MFSNNNYSFFQDKSNNMQKSHTVSLDDDMVECQFQLIKKRNEQLNQIESDTQEINSLFKDIHQLVLSQAPLVDLIGENIENARSDTNSAVKNVRQAEKKSHSYLCNIL